MTRRRWLWLLVLLMSAHSLAVAADVHPYSSSHGSATTAVHEHAAGDVERSQHTHQHCAHCYHCSWHALSTFPAIDSIQAGTAPPPYRLSLRLAYPTPLFRPPKARLA